MEKLNLKKKKIKENCDLAGSIAHILGIYGQNGSGKTVINGLYLLKNGGIGQKFKSHFCNFISYDDNYAALLLLSLG